ncbi:MAG: hypothetical protein HY741_05555 [Chloroflexi bacterium]|nr:hypothetical protein [Chloroflexota bacterium]
MDSNVLIVGIVVLGLIVIVILLRDRIRTLLVRGSVEKREGELRVEADASQTPMPNDTRASVTIRGNKSIGTSQMEVKREDVEISDNVSVGKAEIKVDDRAKKKP